MKKMFKKKMFQLHRYFMYPNQIISININKGRQYSALPVNHDVAENFGDMMSRRRCEAQRSIIVEVASLSNADSVYKECTAVGDVAAVMHYTTFNKSTNNSKNMLVVEFSKRSSVEELMNHKGIRSPFFLYNNADNNQANIAKKMTTTQLITENYLSKQELSKKLMKCKNVSEQMQLYYNTGKSTDIGTRLRFLSCQQIELLLSGTYQYAKVLPFGSSVNGFGVNGSDLDMVLQLNDDSPPHQQSRSIHLLPQPVNNQQFTGSHLLAVVAGMLTNFTPGCQKIDKILRARVPIIKYNQVITGLDCDLSMSNESGVYMSEMLYQYSLIDQRVGPLVFSLRLWAHNYILTSEHPGRWITNFSITLLALFYLIRAGLLPPMTLLQQHARSEDRRHDEHNRDCSFLRDVRQVAALHCQPDDVKTLTLAQLLHGFFAYYHNFDFRNKGISIVQGAQIMKTVENAMYIQNPLDVELNVSRNVTLEEMDRFSRAVEISLTTFNDQQPSYEKGTISTWMGNKATPRLWNVNLGQLFKDGTGDESAAQNAKLPVSETGRAVVYSAVQHRTNQHSSNKKIALSHKRKITKIIS